MIAYVAEGKIKFSSINELDVSSRRSWIQVWRRDGTREIDVSLLIAFVHTADLNSEEMTVSYASAMGTISNASMAEIEKANDLMRKLI